MPPQLSLKPKHLLSSHGKVESLEEYWWCTYQALVWPGADDTPNLIVDDGGDATLLIHEGVKAEKIFKETGVLPDPNSTEYREIKIVLQLIKIPLPLTQLVGLVLPPTLLV